MSVIAIVAVALVLVVAVLAFLRRAGAEVAPDAQVLSHLRQAGSDLSKTHHVEFFMYFPDEEAAQRIASRLVPQGFGVRVEPAADGRSEWLVLATRPMVPQAAELERLRGHLTALASSEGGSYDGWGAPVVQ
jgi:hypothetical protein